MTHVTETTLQPSAQARIQRSPSSALIGWFHGGPRAAWALLALLLSVALPVVFSWPRAPISPDYRQAWERYWSEIVQQKIDDPLHDYRTQFEPQQHEAKRNYRLTIPLLARLTGTGMPGVHAIRFLFHFALLAALALAAERACGDRIAALGAALAVGGTYVGTSAWRDVSLWFDNCAHAFIAVTMATRRPWIAGPAAFLGLLTDERVLVALPLVVAFHHFLKSPRSIPLSLLGATGAYFLVRALFATQLGFLPPMEGLGGKTVWLSNLKFAPVVYWFALEGGWILVALALQRMRTTNTRAFWLLAGVTLLPVLAATAIGDFSRSASYGFPATLVAVACWRACATEANATATLRRVTFLAAGASLLMPNVGVMVDLIVEQNLPTHLILSWLSEATN